jgi:hypothetical protein
MRRRFEQPQSVGHHRRRQAARRLCARSFDPKNGYNPNGASHYSQEFPDRYFVAQAKRMNAFIDAALSAQARMKTGDYPYPDDDIFIIPSGGNPGAGPGGGAVLTTLDPSIADRMSTAQPDYCSSNNSTTCAVQSISVPIMIAATGGYQFIRDDEMIFEKSASRDKDYIVIEGALHGFGPCTACEKDERAIFEHDEESLRLHPRLDEQAVLKTAVDRWASGNREEWSWIIFQPAADFRRMSVNRPDVSPPAATALFDSNLPVARATSGASVRISISLKASFPMASRFG